MQEREEERKMQTRKCIREGEKKVEMYKRTKEKISDVKRMRKKGKRQKTRKKYCQKKK